MSTATRKKARPRRRYDLVIEAVKANLAFDQAKAHAIVEKYRKIIADHRTYIERYGLDPQEVTDWQWT